MKIIVVHASAGAGHSKAAEAIYDALKGHLGPKEIRIIDVLKESTPVFRFTYRGYSFLVRHAVFLWGFLFRFTSLKPLQFFIRPIALITNLINLRGFLRLLICDDPDFVISTHFLPSEITAYIRRKGKIKSRLITVITDYGVHPFWLAGGTDKYIAASSTTKEQLLHLGIKEESILVSGIPVGQRFSLKYDKGILLNKFKLDKSKFTILIATGSFGIGPIKEIVELLYKEVQILVVCAHNKNLYRQLLDKDYPNVGVFDFIDNIHELMAVSELIITKPGGLSIAESLNMGLVPVFISPIPGQETENARIVVDAGAGISAANTEFVRDIVLELKNNPDKLASFKEGVRRLRKPDAVGELVNVVC